jgi:Tfp pilus assembly protein PilO
MGDVDLLAHFPYRELKVTVTGTAYYHDLGKFIADFENEFPHIRIVNLTVEPTASVTQNNSEKLTFSMEIVALVKASAS